MPIFLQAVDVPERCLLNEVLFWVAFQRLPVGSQEARESYEFGDYAAALDDTLSEEETKRAGIPKDPRLVALLEDKPLIPVSFYDRILTTGDLDDDFRKKMKVERKAAKAFEIERRDWQFHYERAIEYPESRIFGALKDGLLRAMGRLLPDADIDVAHSKLEAEGRGIVDIAPTEIPPEFWRLRGIDFVENKATDGDHSYCYISFGTDDVFSAFPGEREAVKGIDRIGDSYVIREGKKPSVGRSSLPPRGRPPYPWDAFHLEVAALLLRNELPEKKEAAILHFQQWFLREHRIEASRSAVGEKLKPYYDRFMKSGGQKSG
jgi:hypothetical protein